MRFFVKLHIHNFCYSILTTNYSYFKNNNGFDIVPISLFEMVQVILIAGPN